MFQDTEDCSVLHIVKSFPVPVVTPTLLLRRASGFPAHLNLSYAATHAIPPYSTFPNNYNWQLVLLLKEE